MNFFVIAGTDGSGKSTQTRLLKEKLESIGKKAFIFDFPDYSSFYGELIGKYLNGEFGDPIKLNPYLISILYADDRKLKRDEIYQKLKEGFIVLCNRYVESNIAHQSIKLPKEEQEKFKQWDYELEYNINKLPIPKKSFFLYLPFKYRLNLMRERLKKENRRYTDKLDGHESNGEYQFLVEKKYIELAEKENWVRVNMLKDNETRSKESILNEIYDNIIKLIE